MVIDAIILARGGSKGIPNKNIMEFCGKPLLVWTIEQCIASKNIRNVWVSSDSSGILDIANMSGALSIKRPLDISGDHASSESGWLHAIEYIEERTVPLDVVLAPQVTSPLRETSDIDFGIKHYIDGGFDSLFSCCVAEDLYFWEESNQKTLISVNYNYKNRKRRQDLSKQYIENGSFYIFSPKLIRQENNRLGGKIGCTEMDFWKMFEIDTISDTKMCSALMKEFLLTGKS